MAHSYTTAQIGKVTLGTNTQAESMIFKTDGPLDDRVALKVPASLISSDALGSKNYVYPAMTCTIESTGDIYILKNKSALNLYTTSAINAMSDTELQEAIDAAWIRVPNSEDISNLRTSLTQSMQTLAGVFQFKGVAHSIDPDNTTITVNSGSKTVSGTTTSGYVCNGFYYDMSHDPFYEWKKDSDTVYVNGTKVYTKSANESTVWYVDYQSTRYYAKDIVSNKVTSFQSLDGGIIYPAGDGINSATATNFYSDETTKDATTLLASLTPQSYSAYVFTEVSGASFSGTAISPAEAKNTTGWVYQIGEKEYASNGLIWVELGSPKDEITWLVINS